MTELINSKEDIAIKCAKECGLNDEQIEAMSGMISFIRVKQMKLFVKKGFDDDKIREWVKRYAPLYLNASELSVFKIVYERVELIKKLGDVDETRQIKKLLMQYFYDCIKSDKGDFIQSLTPEFLHSDNST